MKKTLLLGISTLLFSSFCLAAPKFNDKAIKQLQQNSQQSDLAYELVASLTTEIGPRLAGSENDLKAVDWAHQKMTELGFDKIYKQPVQVRDWQRVSASLQVSSPYQHELNVSALGGSISTPEQGIKASVVRFESLLDLQQANRQDVEGKIVYLAGKMERDKTGESYAKQVSARTHGAIAAAKLGAKAVIIRSISTASSANPHTGSLRYHPEIAKIPAAAIGVSSAELLDRLFSYDKGVEIALNIQNQEQNWKTSYNVIGEITGSTTPDEYVLLGAHLDSWDLGTGALDNGAGVAIVTAAAHAVKQLGQPKRSIRVVLFANEEFGLKGAKAFAKQHEQTLDNIVVAAESDFGAGDVWRFDTRVAHSALSFTDEILAKVRHLSVMRGHNRALGGPDVSVLAKLGVPVVNWLQDGRDYFDYHHSQEDTLDKIDPKNLQQNVSIYATFAYMVANSDINFRNQQDK
ncbi:M20/M25/M40 family metallo-hydrolase [Marinifaba aquimaris]|uniref:M20/M25/M40 family metallo-hydrolase n=1 Tax=Marinifaba aquimaris TaxID=2741323 RepID=UPI001FE42088|nr:M20/M25/M40 family metallo-hydrolase [Marinifaba aquimaris]